MSDLLSDMPPGSLIVLTLFVLLSLGLCILQIYKGKKLHLRTACKVSISIPLLYCILITFIGFAKIFKTMTIAETASPSIMSSELSASLISIILGLWITILLLIFYAITFTISDNITARNR